MSRLIANGIIRSYRMRQRRIGAVVKPPTGIVSNCNVWFPYEMKKVFDRILHELQYLDREHPHHFTLDLEQLDRIFEHRFIQSSSYSFPVTSVKLEYMFDTLGFLWLHYGSPPYLLYLLEKLVDGLSDERMKPLRSTTTTTL